MSEINPQMILAQIAQMESAISNLRSILKGVPVDAAAAPALTKSGKPRKPRVSKKAAAAAAAAAPSDAAPAAEGSVSDGASVPDTTSTSSSKRKGRPKGSHNEFKSVTINKLRYKVIPFNGQEFLVDKDGNAFHRKAEKELGDRAGSYDKKKKEFNLSASAADAPAEDDGFTSAEDGEDEFVHE